MKIKLLFSAVVLSLSFMTAEAKLKFKVGLETGYQLYVGEHLTPHSDNDSKEVEEKESLSNYNPFLPTDEETYLHCFFGGVTGEFLWGRERFGITTGARYTQFIDIYDFDESQTISSDEGEEEIISSNQLTQRTHYVGVPLEFRILASRPGRPCRFYFKMGSSWNFLMATENIVKTKNPITGEESEEKPSNVGREPDQFMGTLYPAIGCRFFRYYPLLNVELQMPSFLINMPTSYFAYNIGLGLNVSIQFPTDKKAYDKNRPMGVPYY
ncbi:MAG: outer membrane beta-barrel protein [Paludibacteraceae bacterium]|nr:outer membrane beta-barrel protein [Paludibacteraceae bacterium]